MGLARLPRDTGGMRNYRRSAVVERCCVEENRRRAVSYVSTGLARLPRDTGGMRNYRRSAVVETPRTIATYIFAERRNSSVTRYAERNGGVPEVLHYLWPDGFPRMLTMPLTQLFSLKYFPCFIQPLFGGRFFFCTMTPGRLANLGL